MEIRNLSGKPSLNKKDSKVTGTAVVFNQWSEDLGGFIETIDPKAFDNVDLEDIVLLYNHDTGAVLSRTSANTLSINIDENGLHFTGELPDTTLGKDVLTNLRNGNIQGMSFGFTIDDDDWEETENSDQLKHIIKSIGKLYEISLTPFPAYKETDVTLSERSKKKYQTLEADKAWLELQKELNIKEI